MIKQLRLGLILLVCSMAASATPNEIVNELRSATNQLIVELRGNAEHFREDPDCLRKEVKKVADKYFDMRRISRLSLGKHWRRFNRKDRANFVIQFEKLLLKTYGTVLLNNLDAKIDWGTKPTKNKGVVIVRAKILNGGGGFITIDFVMRTGKGYEGYRIYNIVVEGVSLVTNYRASFTKVIRTKGIGGLIDMLRNKNQLDICPLIQDAEV